MRYKAGTCKRRREAADADAGTPIDVQGRPTMNGTAVVEGWEALVNLARRHEDTLAYLTVHQYSAGDRTDLIAKVVLEGDGQTDLTPWLMPEAVVPGEPVARADRLEAGLACTLDAIETNPGSPRRPRRSRSSPRGCTVRTRSPSD